MLILEVTANNIQRANSRSSSNLEFSHFSNFRTPLQTDFSAVKPVHREKLKGSLDSSARYASNESSPIFLGHSVQAVTSDEIGQVYRTSFNCQFSFSMSHMQNVTSSAT